MSGILVITDHTRGTFSALTSEMLGLAAQLRTSGLAPVRVVVVGRHMKGAADSLALDGVDEIVLVDCDAPEFDGGLYERAAAQLAERYEPELILVGHSANGMAYAAGLAVALGAGFAADVFDVAGNAGALRATRSGYDNKVNVSLDFMDKCVTVLTVRGGSFKAPAARGVPKIDAIMLDPAQVSAVWTHGRFIDPPNEGVDVSKSEFILAVGRGIQDEKNVPRFAALAERLGATLACSRPVADSGWLPKSRQVGLTGKPAAGCKLYVALGISGAVQHLWGMKHVETIIAVNTDPSAPMFGVAKYGVVGDLFEFVDALEKLLLAA